MNSFMNCCALLDDSVKVADRKKRLDQFKRLIQKPDILDSLDRNTDKKQKSKSQSNVKLFAWDNVFRAIRQFIDTEVSQIRKQKSRASSSTSTSTQQKKKDDVSGLFKFIIKLTDKRGPRLNCNVVMNHIKTVLSDNFSQKAFGMDYSSVLLKDILCVRKYWTQVPPSLWHDMIVIYCDILEEQTAGFDHTVLARVINSLVLGGTTQTDIDPTDFFTFCTKLVKSAKTKPSVLEHILTAMNTLGRNVACSCRVQLCTLGENIFTKLLYLWSHRPSDRLKDEIVSFLHLQMCAHHPKGVREDKDGAFAVDWELWKEHLKKLYSVIYTDLQELCSRSKFVCGSQKASLLSANYISLAASVCQQLFTDATSIIEVTQTGISDTPTGRSAKRRKIESGWQVIQEVLLSMSKSVLILPWLQLVRCLLYKYPDSFPVGEITDILSTLRQVFSNCKRSEVIALCLSCMESLAHCHAKKNNDLSPIVIEELTDEWMNIWKATLRLIVVSDQSIEKDSYRLLISLIELRLVTKPGQDIWTFYRCINTFCRRTPESMKLLCALLKYTPVPENLSSDVFQTPTRGSFVLRKQLLDWLLANKDDYPCEFKAVDTSEAVCPIMLGNTLVAIAMRDTDAIDMTQFPLENIYTETSTLLDELGAIEDIYNKASFGVVHRQEPYSSTNRNELVQPSFLINIIFLKIQELIKRDSIAMLRESDNEVKMIEQLCSVAFQATVLSKLLQGLCYYGLVIPEKIKDLDLSETFKSLLKKVTSLYVNVLSDVSINEAVLEILKCNILVIYDIPCECPQLKDVFNEATSSTFLDKLLDYVSLSRSSARQSSGSGSTLGHRAQIDDDFDMDIEDGVNGDNEFSDDDGFFPNDSNSQESDKLKDMAESPLHVDLLSTADKIRLCSADVLCSMCNVLSGDRAGDTKSRLLSIMDEVDWDITHHSNLHLMILLIDKLTTAKVDLSDNEIDIMISAPQSACQKFSRYYDVMCEAVRIVSKVVPFLSSHDRQVSEIKESARRVALHLIVKLWKSQTKSCYPEKFRFSIAQCLLSFIKCDTARDWTVLKIESEHSTQSNKLVLATEFTSCLKDSSLVIQLWTASAIKSLFVDDSRPLDQTVQNDIFTSITNVFGDCLPRQTRHRPEELDKYNNKISSLLLTFSTIACVSLCCEKKALTAFCILMKKHGIDMTIVKKVLSHVAVYHHYPSLTSYLEAHLPFIIKAWLTSSFEIHDLPFQLLECASLTVFYRKYSDVIIPQVVMKEHLDPIHMMADELGMDYVELITTCLPKILVHILPLFASNNNQESLDTVTRQLVKRANTCYSLLERECTSKVIEASLDNNLVEIVVYTLQCLYDPQREDDGRCVDPEPNPPYYNTETILATLDYLTKSSTHKQKSLVSLLSKAQDGIQKVLLHLSQRLYSSQNLFDKRRVLLMYRLFVQLLLKEFHQQLGGNWAFVLRDVIYRLVHTIQQLECSDRAPPVGCKTVSMCISLLKDVCRVGIQVCPMELGKYFSVITSTLVPIILSSNQLLSKQASQLVHYLVIDKVNNSCIQDAIVQLNPFPCDDVFKTFTDMQNKLKYLGEGGQYTLAQELQHFLKVLQHQHETKSLGSVYTIKFLHKKLQEQRDELEQIVHDCQDKQGNHVLVSVVSELVHLTQSVNHEVAVEAASCLGEIGPVELSIVNIQPQQYSSGLKIALDSYHPNMKQLRNCHIFHELNTYLIDPSVEIGSAASEVLKSLLSTDVGIAFYRDYKQRLADKSYLFQYLHPFKLAKKKMLNQNKDSFSDLVDSELLWIPHHNDHKKWITNLVCTLIESGAIKDNILNLLKPICQAKAEFCELVLPYIIHDILSMNNSSIYRDVLSQHINKFFARHCGIVQKESSRAATPLISNDDEETICSNKNSVIRLIQVVQYLRTQERKGESSSSWHNNHWLNVDFLQLAKAAQSCNAHFATLLFAEIWCDIHMQRTPDIGSRSDSDSQDFPASQMSQADVFSNMSTEATESNINLQSLMLESYRLIGVPDGVYGCGAGKLPESSARIHTYEHENRWDKALRSYDLQMTNPTVPVQAGLLQALQTFGCSHVLEKYLQAMSVDGWQESQEIQELQYEAAYRNNRWSLDIPSRLEPNTYHQSVYAGLCALQEKDTSLLSMANDSAREATLLLLGHSSLESVRSLYPAISKLHCLNVIEQVSHILTRPNSIEAVLDSWDRQTSILQCEFDFYEPILNLRCVLLKVLFEKQQTSEMYSCLVHESVLYSKMARLAGKHQISEKVIHHLHEIHWPSVDETFSWRLEEARTYWDRGEHNTAKYLLKSFKDNLYKNQGDSIEAAKLYAEALGTYGDWLAETRSESPNIIMQEYLEQGVKLLQQLGDVGDTTQSAYLSLARFADSQYQSIVTYTKSSIHEAKLALMDKSSQEAQKLKNINDQSRYLRTLQKQMLIDQREIEQLEADKSNYMKKAIENYLKCLQHGDQHDLRIFRLTSLWFDNAASMEVNKMIKSSLPFLKSYKFLPLMSQLAARMSVKTNHCELFQPTLDKIIETTAIEHPYHTLYIILALANANRETEMIAQLSQRTQRSSTPQNSINEEIQEDRVKAAKKMIERLKRTKVNVSLIAIERLCDTYIRFADWNVEKHKTEKGKISIPSGFRLVTMKDLTHVAVPTLDIKVDHNCNYEDIVYIHKFEGHFKLAGGVNLPKIITCICSDGQARRQLVKGKDDLRQDAVMQQVFGMVNQLLQKDSETRRRKLAVTTYKVIPLSRRSGVLEWCEGTVPLGDYLIGRNGAHQRYRPNDWLAIKCRKHMTEQLQNSVQEKYDSFLDICANFKPVLRHFFWEKFLEPSLWYERRTAYTRSVATNSIVGYILGLGDRHVANILINCNTAELVHIDLGIAFELGKILPTPETVPFRLTRDIMDGMGVTGVEGVFRRCCEKTMIVMHQSQEALLTILQVLLYDPLSTWTLSPQKAMAIQQADAYAGDLTSDGDVVDNFNINNNNTDDVNKMAERVLLRLRQKLQGIEDNVQLSVSGQVNHLIQEAKDPKNLSRLFPGWQPYL